MDIPHVDEPLRYRGLYVYDFGEWTALGYTAEEIAILLESPDYVGGKVYKIARTSPDGGMELKGVSPQRFQSESAMMFNRHDADDARRDFDTLVELGRDGGAPCRAFVHLADRGEIEGVARHVTALIYPAEYEEEVARWLLDADFAGGDTVEGGPSHVANYNADEKTILQREQLWSRTSIPARDAEEVFRSVRIAVQR